MSSKSSSSIGMLSVSPGFPEVDESAFTQLVPSSIPQPASGLTLGIDAANAPGLGNPITPPGHPLARATPSLRFVFTVPSHQQSHSAASCRARCCRRRGGRRRGCLLRVPSSFARCGVARHYAPAAVCRSRRRQSRGRLRTKSPPAWGG